MAFQKHGENPQTAALLDTIRGAPIGLGRAEELSWSPDGRHVRLVRQGSNCVPILRTLATDGTIVSALTSGLHSDDVSFTWSPDGRAVAFLRWQNLPAPICGSQGGYLPPENTVKDIIVMAADGSNQRVLVTGGWPWLIAWSPDGTRIAFTEWLRMTTDNSYRLSVVDVATGTIRELTEGTGYSEVSWSPDGRQIRVRSYDTPNTEDFLTGSRVVAVDPETGSIEELLTLGAGTHEVAWSPDGRRAAAVVDVLDGNTILPGNIDVWTIGTGSKTTLKLGDVQSLPLAWSPDGVWVAFTRVESPDTWGYGGIDLATIDGSGRREVPSSAGYVLVGWQPR